MATLGIDGLVSGLDTTSLINQLMQVEAMPQTLLKRKQSTTQTLVSALQSLNTKVASLTESAQKTAKPESWDAVTAKSSATSVTANATATAQPGSVSFTVEQVAAAKVALSRETLDDSSLVAGIPPAVTVKKADGTFVTVEPTSGSLNDIARALNNAADSGVKATVVRVGVDADDKPLYRLQFTGTSTGSDGGFEVYAGTQAEVEGYDAAALAANRLDATEVTAAADARITLWKGTAAEKTFQQSSNTFSGLMTGVDVTVSKVTGAGEDPVTVTVAQDADALKKLASGLVGSLGVVLSEVASRTATTTKTNTDGSTAVTGGLFSGDGAVRQLQQQLTTAMGGAVTTASGELVSPSSVGLVIGRDGTFTFDEAKFSAALTADPARVRDVVTQVADRVAQVASGASDKTDGTLTRKIQGQEGLVKDMGTQIEQWDRRLELRRANLQRTYSALEVTLSGLQSQSSWLAGQLATLPSYSSK
ncbi:flagellar filament capping protein FliD [Thalassiella azotivora]